MGEKRVKCESNTNAHQSDNWGWSTKIKRTKPIRSSGQILYKCECDTNGNRKSKANMSPKTKMNFSANPRRI